MGAMINVRYKDDLHIYRSTRNDDVLVAVYYHSPLEVECAKCGRYSEVREHEFSMNQEELKLVIAELTALIKKEE